MPFRLPAAYPVWLKITLHFFLLQVLAGWTASGLWTWWESFRNIWPYFPEAGTEGAVQLSHFRPRPGEKELSRKITEHCCNTCWEFHGKTLFYIHISGICLRIYNWALSEKEYALASSMILWYGFHLEEDTRARISNQYKIISWYMYCFEYCGFFLIVWSMKTCTTQATFRFNLHFKLKNKKRQLPIWLSLLHNWHMLTFKQW